MAEGRLGTFAITNIVVGSVIGSGIFILPALMTAQVPSPLLVMLAFVGGGIISLFGALTLAELGGMYPKEGGQYVFLRETVGPTWGFLYGWTAFWVVQTGIIAAVALAFGRFAGLLFGYDDAATSALVAVAGIVVLTLINLRGVTRGAAVQNITTVAKLAALGVLVIGGFLMARPDHRILTPLLPDGFGGWDLATTLGLAALTGIFAYDGWYYATYMAGEAKDPQRSIPKGLALGMLVVVGTYLAAVVAYFYVLPADDVAAVGADGNARIAAAVAEAFLGGPGVFFVAIAVMISTFGAVNGTILTSPRLFRAIANDGRFWHPFAKTSKRTQAPHMALVFQAEWACFLVLLSIPARDAYLALVNSIVFGIWLFFIPTAIGYFRMRRLRPDMDRPYRTWGHPVVPALFLGAAVVIVVNGIVGDIRAIATVGFAAAAPSLTTFWGALMIGLGVPFALRDKFRQRRPVLDAIDAEAS